MRKQLHLGQPSMALVAEKLDVIAAVKGALRKLRRKMRQQFCTIIHGGHELYKAHTDTKLYQQCLLCGYETHGWTIDRRDRRLHLVRHDEAATASRTRR